MSHSVQDFCCNDHLGVEPSGPALTAMFLNTSSRLSFVTGYLSRSYFSPDIYFVPYNKAKQAVL